MPDYSLFGLRIRSERTLPELHEVGASGQADVSVRFEPIEAETREAGLHRLGDAILFIAPDAGRYRVSAGREIIVEANKGVPDRNVRLYLLGSAFGALLHQRGLLPLHANAIAIEGRAFAFIGAQGEGKSTLAAWFHDQGDDLIADDICVVTIDDGRPMALPGLPRLRLWEDALIASGRTNDDYLRSYVGDEQWNKFDVPIGAERTVSAPLPLAAVYLMQSGDAFEIAPLSGLDAAEALFEHTYRGAYLDAADGHAVHWAACVELVRRVPIFRLTRRRGFDIFEEQGRLVRQHAADVPGGSRRD